MAAAMGAAVRWLHAAQPPPRMTKLALLPPKSVEVAFADGSSFHLPAEFLRVSSPAADSKIRSVAGEKVIFGRRHVGIMSAESVGNYGVRILFDDLHKTGIFTWDYLHHLGSNKYEQLLHWFSTVGIKYLVLYDIEGVLKELLQPGVEASTDKNSRSSLDAGADTKSSCRSHGGMFMECLSGSDVKEAIAKATNLLYSACYNYYDDKSEIVFTEADTCAVKPRGGEACRSATMAAQALLSGRQLLGRPLQSSFSRSGSSRKASFIVRAGASPPAKQGADRQLWFASKQSLSYLDGTLPGDFGFDPLGLSDPEGTGGFIEPRWLAYGEVFNGRTAMMGVVGMIAPELLGKVGLVPSETAIPWFQSGVIPPAGTYNYWADPYTLFVFELALVGFAEHRRFQDWYTPGSMSKQYFLGLEKYLGGSGEPAYPGGPLFNPLGFGTKSEAEMKELKLKEIKNGRLAMLAFLGFSVQALFTGVGPVQNLQDHLADPVNNNILTSLKFH
ncbi:hypothetical protein GUJ93_ZPchr0006g41033 [Zizania palustris]|uniref:Chlorophyll a-b binding protein, chloroplastic n=1 Tax=Zizania palustris TaxID=103762 RepID=A0A8J5T6F8_ZIZPA|nr:hypothetical protein GUJ93_ZPchr0006g41033 [Zizania palustris]